MKFTLAMCQMLVEGGKPDANLASAVAMIRQAAAQNCAVAILPECLDLGWTHPCARTQSQPIPGPHTDPLCQAARETGLYVAAGLTERAGAKIYNAAVLISPQGEIISHHRKINELSIAHDLYSIGDRLSVVETPLGVMALDICADNFQSSLVLGHSLAYMGAQVILSPCAWAVDAAHKEEDGYGQGWRESYGVLGKLHGITTIGVSNVGPIAAGPWAGRKCIGCSLAVGPEGAILAQGPYGEFAEALIAVEVEPAVPKAKGTDIAAALQKQGYPVREVFAYRKSPAV